MVTKQEADEIMKIPGNTKASETKTLAKYVRIKYGEKGLVNLENKLEELEYPLHFDKLRLSDWHPNSHYILAMIVAKDLFGWKDLYEFGYASPALSMALRFFLPLVSIKQFLYYTKNSGWKRFMDFGMTDYELNEKEKWVKILIKNYKTCPEECRYYSGLTLRLVEIASGGKKGTVEETKCVHKGDPYHEFLIKWE